MSFMNSEHQLFNQDQSNQTNTRLKEYYILEMNSKFLNHFIHPSLIQQILITGDILLRIAIIIYSVTEGLRNPVNLGLLIIVSSQTLANFFINLFFFKSYNTNQFMGSNQFSKFVLNFLTTVFQIDTLFFKNQCKSTLKSTIDVSTYNFSPLFWFYIKRISTIARIHLIVFFFFKDQANIDPFQYIVFSFSFLQVIYFNQVNSNIFFSSARYKGFFEQIITNIELILQFIQSVLFIIFISTTSLALVILYLPVTTLLFSMLQFMDQKMKFDPFTIGVLEYIFMGQNSCNLIPILKNDFASVQIHLGGVLKLLYLIIFTVVQTVIWAVIMTVHKEELPDSIFEVQIILIAIISGTMIIKFIKVFTHLCQQFTVQASGMRDINLNKITNYQQKKISPEELNVLEQLMNKNQREYYININNQFSIQTFHRHTELIVQQFGDLDNLKNVYLSLLKHQNSLNLSLAFNCQKQPLILQEFFIFILKNMIYPNKANIAFNKSQLIEYLTDQKKTKNNDNIDEILNFPKKTVLEYIIFEKNYKNLLYNNHFQVYYDLFDDIL